MIKTKAIIKIFALAASLVLAQNTLVIACVCEMTPIKEHIKANKYVVVGRVTQLLDTKKEREDYYYYPDSNRSYRVQLEVETVYKGRLKKSQIIELGSEFTNCDIHFKNHEKYLLFLYKKNKKYCLRHCSYNEHIDNAKQNIAEIEKIRNKQK